MCGFPHAVFRQCLEIKQKGMKAVTFCLLWKHGKKFEDGRYHVASNKALNFNVLLFGI